MSTNDMAVAIANHCHVSVDLAWHAAVEIREAQKYECQHQWHIHKWTYSVEEPGRTTFKNADFAVCLNCETVKNLQGLPTP